MGIKKITKNIPVFENNDKMKDIREGSLNPLIETVNALTDNPGGYFFDPSPVEEGKNLFKAADKAAAESARDNYFTTNPSVLAEYDNREQRMIILQYTDSGTLKNLQQSRLPVDGTSQWVSTFGVASTAFNLKAHSVTELSDGAALKSTVENLDTEVNDSSTGLVKKVGDNISRLGELEKSSWELDGSSGLKTGAGRGNIKVEGNSTFEGNTSIIGNLIINGRPISEGDPQLINLSDALRDAEIKVVHDKLSLDCTKTIKHFISSDHSIDIDPYGTGDDCKIDLKAVIPETLHGYFAGFYNTLEQLQKESTEAFTADKSFAFVYQAGDSYHNHDMPIMVRFTTKGNPDGDTNPVWKASVPYSYGTLATEDEGVRVYKPIQAIMESTGISLDESGVLDIDTSLTVKGKKTDGSTVTEKTKVVQFIDGLTVQKETDGSIKVKTKAVKQMESFLGFYDSEAAIFAKAIEKKSRLIPEVTTAYLRHSPFGVTTEESGSYEIYRWKGSVSKPSIPTDDDIKNVDNWHTGIKLATGGFPVVLLGTGTPYPSWVPTNTTTYQPAHYTGQVIYHTNDKSWYWSNGTNWTKLFPTGSGDSSLFLGFFGSDTDLPTAPVEKSWAYVLNPTEAGVVQRANPTMFVYQGSRWGAEYPRGSIIVKNGSRQFEHVEKIQITGGVGNTITDGVLQLSLPSGDLDGKFLGFFNTKADLETAAETHGRDTNSYGYVLEAEGEGSKPHPHRLIPAMYQWGGVDQGWIAHHVKGAIICKTDKSAGDDPDRPIEAIKFTGDGSKVVENPNRNLTVEIPFTMDSHFVGIFENMTAFTESAKTYKGKFIKYQITGIVKQVGEYKLVRWNQDTQRPVPADIDNDTHWDRIPLGSGGSGTNITFDGNKVASIKKNPHMFLSESGELDIGDQYYSFLGYYESAAALREACKPWKRFLDNNDGASFGLVRKQAYSTTSSTKTHYYRVHKWICPKSGDDVTDADVLADSSWDQSETFLGKDLAITIVGDNSEHLAWRPEVVDSTLKASEHVGQIVYYNTSDAAAKGHYYSNGDIWQKFSSGSGGVSTPITMGGKPINSIKKTNYVFLDELDDGSNELTVHGTFLGIHDSQAALFAAAKVSRNILTANVTFGYVRKSSTGGKDSHYYRIWIWKGPASVTDSDIENTVNWDNSFRVLNANNATTVTGSGTEYPSWTPEQATEGQPLLAKNYLGQIVYFNHTDANKAGHYYSNGNIWTKLALSGSGNPIGVALDSVDKTGALQKIDVLGDPNLFSYEDGELSLNLKNALVRADDLAKLNSEYPVNNNKSIIGYTDNNHKMYVASNKDSTTGSFSWQEFAYPEMNKDVDSCISRYPEQVELSDQFDDTEVYQKTGLWGITETKATNLKVPVAQAGVLESKIAKKTVGSTQELWVQIFSGLETGQEWKRYRIQTGSSHEWSAWKEVVQKLPLDDTNFTILTVKNGTKGKDIQGAAIPWRKVQDNTCNVKQMTNNALRVLRDGKYRITIVTHFSGKDDWTDHVANVTTELFFVGDSAARYKKAGSITAGGSGNNPGEYPAAKAVFEVDLASHESFDIRHIVTKGGDTYISESDLDPYKNYVVIEPVNSDTSTGVEIAETLCESLGGISFLPGQEVRMEPLGSGNRVLGERYRIDVVDLA